MGNKSGTPSSKKQNHNSIYQQEQLNRIEREIQEDHSSIYLSQQVVVHANNNSKVGAIQSAPFINNGNQTSSFPFQENNSRNKDGNLAQEGSHDSQNYHRSSSNKQMKFHSQTSIIMQSGSKRLEVERNETKMSITELENQLSTLIRKENYFGALEKLFEILFLNRKINGNSSEQVAFTMHRMSSILCLLGRLEEALKYEYDSCQIRKNIFGSVDVNIAKSLIYIAKLLWYFKKYIQSFYYILESYNISESPSNRLNIELKSMIGEVSLEMSNIAHENEQFILSFKLRVLAFQSKRAAFLFDESYIDDDLTMLAHEVWNYKSGIFLLQMIPTQNYSATLPLLIQQNGSNQQEDNCPICYIEFIQGDQQKELLCSHKFHSHCIDRWIIKNQKCPMCRKSQELQDYLTFQQNRLKQIQIKQNEKILQKQKKFPQFPANQDYLLTQQSKQKYQKQKAPKQQNHVTELVQISPRTSATFSFLQKEIQNKEIDIFMQDYNQHFNLLPLPLPSSNSNKNNQETNPINTPQEKKKTLTIQNSQNSNIIISNDQKQESNLIQSSINYQNQRQQQNLDFEPAANFAQYDSNGYNNNNDNNNQFGGSVNEEEEEQKQVGNHYSEYDSYYPEEQHAYYQYNRNADQNNIQIKETENSNLSYQDQQYVKAQVMNQQELKDNQNGLQSHNFLGDRQIICYPSSSILYSDLPNLNSEDFNTLEEFDIHNNQVSYEDEDEKDEVEGDEDEDEDDDDYFDQDNCGFEDDEDEEDYIHEFKFQTKDRFQKDNMKEMMMGQNKCESNAAVYKIQCLQTSLDIDIDQTSVSQQQPQIKEFASIKQLENRYLYFEGEQIEQQDTRPQQYQFSSCLNERVDSNSSQPTQLMRHQIIQKQENECNKRNCICCKIIDDSDVNFDEEGISESNNQFFSFGCEKRKDLNSKNIQNKTSEQQSDNGNNNSLFSFSNINPIEKRILNNQASQLVNQQCYENNEDKLTINYIPSFNSKNAVNQVNNKYSVDDSDIFDKRPTIINTFNNQKVDLFEDDEKENNFLFDTHNIINNNRYMNYY